MPAVRRMAGRRVRRGVLAADPALIEGEGEGVAQAGAAEDADLAGEQRSGDAAEVECRHRRGAQRRAVRVEVAGGGPVAPPRRMGIDRREPGLGTRPVDGAADPRHGHHMPT